MLCFSIFVKNAKNGKKPYTLIFNESYIKEHRYGIHFTRPYFRELSLRIMGNEKSIAGESSLFSSRCYKFQYLSIFL